MDHHEACGCPEYQRLSRRGFLAVGGGAAAMAALAPAWLPRVSVAKDYRGGTRDVMISVFLRGASDGLTICPPHGDASYYAARPTLAIAPPQVGNPNAAIDLDGFFGLAPALSALVPAYQDDKLLVVHACGSTDPSRSHFDAQRFMEVGLANDPTIASGWLGRHLAGVPPMVPGSTLRAVGIATGLQRTLVGAPSTLPIPNLDTFGLAGAGGTIAARTDALGDMFGLVSDPLHSAGLNTIATIDLLNTINFAGYVPGGGAVYPEGGVGTAFRSVAALIKAQVGVEAVAIDATGWDTHNNQGVLTGTMAGLMTTLSQALGALYTDMNSGMNPGYIACVMSEFGRRLEQNGSGGTDHGHGNCMFVMGPCVAGGRVLSNWPGLAPEQLFEGRDLDVTIDYRDILGEVVQQRLGNPDLDGVFPGYSSFKPRGIIAC